MEGMLGVGVRLISLYGELSDWSEISMTRTVEALCNSFELRARFNNGLDGLPQPVNEGDQVLVTYLDAPIMRGFVDAVEREETVDESSCIIRGRSLASIVADSSCRLTGMVLDFPALGITSHAAQFRGMKVEAIAAAICAPYFVSVRAEVDTGEPVAKYDIQAGDKAGDKVQELAERRGLLAYSDALGNIVLSRVADAAIDPPVITHVTRIRYTRDLSQTYPFIHVAGAKRGGAYVGGMASDLSTTPEDCPRTLIIPKHDIADHESAQRLAVLERDTRWGNATGLEITVSGWGVERNGVLRPWRPGQFVCVDYERFNLDTDQQWVIAEVTSGYTEQTGHTSSMVLRYPESLQLPIGREPGVAVRGVAKGTPALAPWALMAINSRPIATIAKAVGAAIGSLANGVAAAVGVALPSADIPPSGRTQDGQVDAGRNATQILDREAARIKDGGW